MLIRGMFVVYGKSKSTAIVHVRRLCNLKYLCKGTCMQCILAINSMSILYLLNTQLTSDWDKI